MGGDGIGIEGGWEAEARQYHRQGGKQQCVGHRNCQSTWTVVSSSLTPQAALLVPISGLTNSVVDRCGFAGSEKDRL